MVLVFPETGEDAIKEKIAAVFFCIPKDENFMGFTKAASKAKKT
jgi:hypothetical protein